MSENNSNAIELTADQIKLGQDRLREIITKVANTDHKGTDITAFVDAAYRRLSRDPELIRYLAEGQEDKAAERMDQLMNNAKKETVIATAVAEDGTEQPITIGHFLDLLNRGLDEEKPDANAADNLAIILESMLEFVGGQPDLLNDPVTARTLDYIKTIYEYLQQGIEAREELDKFLKEQKEFMAIPRPAGLEDFLKISDGKGSKEVNIRQFESSNKITFRGRLTIDEQKINEMIRLAFASNNPYKATKGLNTLIELPFTDVMEILNKPITPDSKKKFSRQLRKETLSNISHCHLEIKNDEGSFVHMEIGGGYFAVNVRRNKIYFKLSDPYAVYLNTGNISQYSSKTLRLGSQSDPLPFYLAIKLQDQYFHDGNRKRGVNSILAIKTLLAFCADSIPSYEYVQKTDRGHWVRRIRKPLEDALNEIKKIGLFEWQYCKKGMAEATPQEIRTNDYRKWSALYITFKLIPEEPDQTERLEHKRERLEATQAKKALKDAETIIKADKIEKRKARKQKKMDDV